MEKRDENKKFPKWYFLKKNSKGALEISFGWLFAIIAGIVIIFLAIYLSSKLINVQQTTVNAETGQQIGILLDPLETSFESAQTTAITIPAETRINNICDFSGIFGEQFIQLDQQSFNKWTKTNINVGFKNKYIFSEGQIEGKKFYIFSKPFDFPFKIADLMYITSSDKRYCFFNAPDEINTEISELNQSNLITGNCSEGDIKICFGNNNCDINVDFNSNSVEKNGTLMYFGGADERALMYAAIFSDKNVYECQVKRLMSRVNEISSLYIEKESLTEKKGCDNNAGADLGELSGLARSLNNSGDLGIVKIKADIVDEENNARMCLLW
jgi:hypothetical protein